MIALTLRPRSFPRLVVATLALLGFAASLGAATTGTGSIVGNVSNAGTGNFLEGARVEIPALGVSALTDNTGRFVLGDLPAGTHEIVASYTGLDLAKDQIVLAAGQRANRNFDLTTGIYQLQAFSVTGEREGNAAAITAQRNATNLKNVVAIDAYGNLPNMNASELAVLLPGVAGSLSDEGNIIGFTIRGMPPALNTITIDGALMASQGGAGRATRIHTITGSMFDSLELTKGHTPDKESGSLGGTVNLKSRSPLGMKEKRRLTYNFSARLAPSFSQQIPLREDHPLHPLLNVAYQEKFSAFGSAEPNFAVAVNLFYSEQAVGFFSTTRDFQNVTSQPAYLWDYRTQDNYNNRKQSSINTKFDFRLSSNTKVALNLIYNDAMERFRLRYLFRAFTGSQTVVPSATSGVIPGFTDRITSVRAIPASTIDITSQMSHFFHRQRHADIGVEQTFGPLQLDYNAVASNDHINGGGGDGGVLVNRVTNVGWTLDRTVSDLYPRFIQTAGPDIANPASYRPNSLNFADNFDAHEIREIRGNARYKLPTELPLFLKTGFRLREEEIAGSPRSTTRYNFTGTNSGQLPTDPTVKTFGDHKTGLKIPAWNANAISRGRVPVDASLWREDAYFREMTKFTGSSGVSETVTAGYLMAQGSIKRTGYIVGVRTERTEDESYGWTRNRVPSTAAQQTADPVGSAQRDYANNRRELNGNYTKSFPSAHLTHDITPNLKARLSWSNSFGRPPLSNLTPLETVNETAQTLTINNPALRPQIAESWDTSLEYYFEPVGNLSVTWFHKTIDDYFVNNVESGIVGPGLDNGYNGEYSGFTLLSRANLGTAVVQGWELSYQQQFTFLPGVLKGLGLSANLTVLETRGNFGGAATRRTGEVPGFVPRTGNVVLSWRHQGIGVRVVANRTGEFINAFTEGSPGRNQYTRARTTVNAGIAYQWRPALSFSMDVQNVFNAPQQFYRGNPDQMSEYRIPGTTITFGVSGRF